MKYRHIYKRITFSLFMYVKNHKNTINNIISFLGDHKIDRS